MICYASRTGTRKNLAALRANGWRLLFTPFSGGNPFPGWPYMLDNGAWTAHTKQEPFNEAAFLTALEKWGADAEMVIAPDHVGGGMHSFRFSLDWLPRLTTYKRVLFAAQDGMRPNDLRPHLSERVGFAIGGSTEWKEATLCDPEWAALASEFYCHVLRVNSKRRIRLCQDFGAQSFDGTSASIYSVNARKLAVEAARPTLFDTDTHPGGGVEHV